MPETRDQLPASFWTRLLCDQSADNGRDDLCTSPVGGRWGTTLSGLHVHWGGNCTAGCADYASTGKYAHRFQRNLHMVTGNWSDGVRAAPGNQWSRLAEHLIYGLDRGDFGLCDQSADNGRDDLCTSPVGGRWGTTLSGLHVHWGGNCTAGCADYASTGKYAHRFQRNLHMVTGNWSDGVRAAPGNQWSRLAEHLIYGLDRGDFGLCDQSADNGRDDLCTSPVGGRWGTTLSGLHVHWGGNCTAGCADYASTGKYAHRFQRNLHMVTGNWSDGVRAAPGNQWSRLAEHLIYGLDRGDFGLCDQSADNGRDDLCTSPVGGRWGTTLSGLHLHGGRNCNAGCADFASTGKYARRFQRNLHMVTGNWSDGVRAAPGNQWSRLAEHLIYGLDRGDLGHGDQSAHNGRDGLRPAAVGGRWGTTLSGLHLHGGRNCNAACADFASTGKYARRFQRNLHMVTGNWSDGVR